MKLECDIKLVEFGSVKALVSVLYGDLELRGFKIVDQKGGDPWVAMPSREYQKDGERQFVNVVWIPNSEKKREFTDSILKEYLSQVKKGSNGNGKGKGRGNDNNQIPF
jgi:DNA-binding cell septation regulator SpoVG